MAVIKYMKSRRDIKGLNDVGMKRHANFGNSPGKVVNKGAFAKKSFVTLLKNKAFENDDSDPEATSYASINKKEKPY